MRKRIKPLLSVAATLALTAALLGWLAGLTERKDSDFKYAPFFAQEADFDVLFFGSSHMINGVFPMELWQDYGIVSYNFGGHLNYIPTSYWLMKNALRYTTPKLVVVDCALLGQQMKMDGSGSYSHLSFDGFPLSLTKVRGVLDLLNDSEYDRAVAEGTVEADRSRTRMGLLWDFSQYHDRWTELNENDFRPGITAEKGAESRVNVAVLSQPVRTDETLEETTGMEYLRRLIRECRQEGIGVLLVYLPFPASETYWREANTAGLLAEEMGVDYIDFLELDTVDFATDCYDSWSHLNPSGARKVTDYLGQYIRTRYGIPDRRQDPAYAGWHDDYGAYTDYKLALLEKQTDWKNYLMLLQDEHLNGCVYLAESGLWTGSYQALLANAGVDVSQLPAQGPALAVLDRDGGASYVLWPGETALVSFGQVDFGQTEGSYAVRVDGKEVLAAGPEAAAGAVIIRAGGQTAAAALFASGPTGEKKLDG